MIGRTNSGRAGGGSSINFSVVGSTTQPTGQDGMIWVNTATEISSFVFSSTQPGNFEAGMVWFQTGTASPAAFSALEDTIVMIYPNSCKQYVNGSWIAKAAKSYLNGAWVPWRTDIFISGTGPTSGWAGIASLGNTGYSITNEKITLKGFGGAYEMGTLVKKTAKIDLTAVSTVYFDVQRLSDSTMLQCGVCATEPSDIPPTWTAYKSMGSTGSSTLAVDVRALSGNHTIACYAGVNAHSYADAGYIFNIYCE